MIAKKIMSKLGNSPSAMAVLSRLLQPLRMLVLVPLVFTKFTTFESDVYFLFASATILTVMARARMCDVFTTMLSFAYAGADDLSPISSEKQRTEGSEPNWLIFAHATRFLDRMQWRLVGPLLLLSSAIIILSIASIRGMAEWNAWTWAVILLGIIAAHVNFLRSPVEAGLKGVGRVVVCYRINIIAALAFVVAGSIAISLNGGLFGLVCVQIVIAMIKIWLFDWYYARDVKPNIHNLAVDRNSELDRKIFEWAWAPMWKSSVGFLAGIGISRIAGIFVANTGGEGSVASFIFAQNILLTMTGMVQALLASQFPRYSRMFAHGNTAPLVRDAAERTGVIVYVMIAGIISSGLILPWLMQLIGSNVNFMELRLWLMYGFLYLIGQMIGVWAFIYGRSNHMPFYRHQIASFILAFFGLVMASQFQSVLGVILSITLCHVITLRLLPFSKLSEVSGVSMVSIFMSILWPIDILKRVSRFSLNL